MKILEEIKHKDGSVTFECDCTEEEINLLTSVGMNTILKDYIDKLKENRKMKNYNFKLSLIDSESNEVKSSIILGPPASENIINNLKNPTNEMERTIVEFITKSIKLSINEKTIHELLNSEEGNLNENNN